MFWVIWNMSFVYFDGLGEVEGGQGVVCVEEVLVDQFVGFQFSNQSVEAYGSAFVESELEVDFVVCDGAIYDVIVVGEVFLRSVGQDEFCPFFVWLCEEEAFEFVELGVVEVVYVEIAARGVVFPHTPLHPFS